MRNTISAMLAVILMISMSQTVLFSEPLSVIEKSHKTDSGFISDFVICDTGTLWLNDSTLINVGKGIHVCDEETGNWTELDDKQTTDQEWIVEQGCDAPTEQQFNNTDFGAVLNDYGQVMVAGEEDATFIEEESSGHDDPDASHVVYRLKTRTIGGTIDNLTDGRTVDEYGTISMSFRNTAIQIGPDIEIEFSSGIYVLNGHGSIDGNTLSIDGGINVYGVLSGFDVSIDRFTGTAGVTIVESAFGASFNGTIIGGEEYTSKFSFNGSTFGVSVTNSTGYEVINVTQTQGILSDGIDIDDTARWSNNTMYDSYDGATVQTNTHISIAKALSIFATIEANGGREATAQTYIKVKDFSVVGDPWEDKWGVDDNENERTGLLFLKGKAIQVGFGEDGDVTEANIIKTNLTIDESVSPEIAEEIIDSALRTPGTGKGIVITDVADYRCEEEGTGYGIYSIDENSKLRLASDDEKQEDSEILVSAAGVDVTERDAVAVGGTFAVTSILWMIGRRYLGGV